MNFAALHKLREIHIISVLIWIYCIGVIKCDSYFTSNSENFESVPTTVKTYENDTVLLPCYSVGEFYSHVCSYNLNENCATKVENISQTKIFHFVGAKAVMPMGIYAFFDNNK